MRVTKIFTFDSGHRLSDYEGKCKHLHGHTYHLEITIEGEVGDDGMVIDFGILKNKVNSILDSYFDHKTVLKRSDKLNEAIKSVVPKESLYIVDYNPTVENMIVDICEKIKNQITTKLHVSRVRLYETPTSYAEICPKKNK